MSMEITAANDETFDPDPLRFYQTRNGSGIIMIAGIVVMVLGTILLEYPAGHKGTTAGTISGWTGTGLAVIGVVGMVTGFYFSSYERYEDPKNRERWLKNFKEEDKNLFELLFYIDHHGIDNIQKWGLRLPPDAHPLMTKEIIRDCIMKEQNISKLSRIFMKNCGLSSDDLIIKNNSIVWTPRGPKFIEIVEKYVILSSEDKREIEKKIVQSVITAQNPSRLIKDATFIESYGFNTTPEMQQLLQWLEEKQKNKELQKEKLDALIQELSENMQNKKKEVIADDNNSRI